MVDLAAVFLVGLAGSVQCVGLCGGVTFALGRTQDRASRLYLHQSLYFLGKTITYSMLGAVAGGFGALIGTEFFGLQSALSVVCGVAVAILGLATVVQSRSAKGSSFQILPRPLSRLLGRSFLRMRAGLRHPSYPTTFGIGLVNGLLPCGLVYVVLIKAVAAGTVIAGAVTMAVFGLATIPVLFVLAGIGFLMRPAWRLRLTFANGALLVVLGLLTIARGAPIVASETMQMLDRYYVIDTVRGYLSNSSIAFEKVRLEDATGRHTSLAIGPDGKLYATTVTGLIKRWRIGDDGTLSDLQIIYALQQAEGEDRLALGLVFDPAARADSLVAWATHSHFGLSGAADWSGKITRLSGPDLETIQDFVINLPRSDGDHATNGLAFGPDGALYVCQGSNSSTGKPDSLWGYRPERLLSAAVLRVDVASLSASGSLPLDVKTDDGGRYDPYAPGAPVKVFASGVRNAYDLLWHSNGSLYVTNNGAAGWGSAPSSVPGARRLDGSVYAGPVIPAIDSVGARNDHLYRVPGPNPDGSWAYHFYGHPNPARGEFVLAGGNPTPAIDSAEVSRYPIGVKPDGAWAGYAYDFGRNASANGLIEYRSDTFGGILKGKLLVVRYSLGDDIIILTPIDDGGTVSAVELPASGLDRFYNPLDLVEHPAGGQIYVSEFGKVSRITLLRPIDDRRSVFAVHKVR